jgi:hypothetical protein
MAVACPVNETYREACWPRGAPIIKRWYSTAYRVEPRAGYAAASGVALTRTVIDKDARLHEQQLRLATATACSNACRWTAQLTSTRGILPLTSNRINQYASTSPYFFCV